MKVFPPHGPFVLAFQDLERFVLAAVDVRRWASATHVMGLDHAERAAGVAAAHADEHGDAENVHRLAFAGGNNDGGHRGEAARGFCAIG